MKTKSQIIALILLLCVKATYADANDVKLATDMQGRENPFAKLTLPTPPPAAVVVEENASDSNQSQAYTQTAEAPIRLIKPEMSVETVMVKYLQAENLKTALENLCTQFGTITVDKNSNSIIICDTRENLQKILAEVRKVNITPQLIEIEVVIVDVTLNNDTEVGVNWDLLSDKTNHVGFRQSLTSRVGSTPENETTVGNATAFNSVGVGSDLSVVTGTVRAVVHLLQSKRKAEILATPRVLVVSGKTASVQTVEEIPYKELSQTSQGGQLTSTQFKMVGVKLAVLATITDNNEILLTVEPEQSINTGSFGADNVPIIDTRRAKTDLLLKDGEVVVMGGLRRKEKAKVREQVPVLGEIPVVGFLFGRDRVVTINSELMVFLAPHIYKGRPLSTNEAKKLEEVKSLPPLQIFNGDEN